MAGWDYLLTDKNGSTFPDLEIISIAILKHSQIACNLPKSISKYDI